MDPTQFTIIRPPKVNSRWQLKDHLGALRVRFSMGRNKYRMNPGLYRLGNPGKESDVLVTSSYKLSFDMLRRSMEGMNAWILVLETYGINVWCAAGKGTFGTEELIRQIRGSRLHEHVIHKRLILPQLGAPGIAAHTVKEATGFTVKFGPVRAGDLPEYISSGYRKNEQMRSVRFSFRDRLILTPVELVNSVHYLLGIIVLFFILSGFQPGGFSLDALWKEGSRDAIFLLGAYLSGAFLAPVLLPLLPFRQFGGKGLVAGLVVFVGIALLGHAGLSRIAMLGWFLLSGAIASFLTMNFTGASTYTSLSGVRKEMRFFVPLQIALAGGGLILVMISKFS